MYFGAYPVLQTNRLQLRHIHAGDLEKVHQGLSDKRVTKFYGVHFNTLEETEGQMEWYESLWLHKTGLWWAVCDRETGTFFGACGFNYYKPERKQVEVGYWLLPEHWGHGYASEALGAAMDFVIAQTEVTRVEAFVEQGNRSSGKLLKKFGFVRERIMRNCELKNDKWITLVLFAYCKPD